MNKGNDNSSRARKTPSKSFSQFLKESDIKPLVFLGKCWQFFGPKCVIAFLVGILSIWLYCLAYPLPGYNLFYKNGIEPKEIILYGNVKIKEEEGGLEPFKNEFQVGVLSGRRHGPFNDTEEADGSFSVEVPHLKKYNIVVWNENFTNFRYFGDKDIQKVDNKYLFKNDLIMFD